MRKVHRFLAVFAVFMGLYVASTGTFLQLIDLQTLFSHAPDNAPNLMAIREGASGPPNFRVLVDADYFAQDLPLDFNFDAGLATVIKSAHVALGDAAVSFVELRMVDGKPVGQVASMGKLLRVDALTGAMLIGSDAAPNVSLPPAGGQPALRNTVKNIHRMTAYGDVGALIFVFVSVALCVMIFTGLALYFRLLKARPSAHLFWFAGSWWRTLHRVIAISASLFLVVIALSGTLLAIGDLGVSAYRVSNQGKRPGLTADVSSPLADAELLPMLHTTLTAYRAEKPAAPVKVLRLRTFAGMPQGLIVTGGLDVKQLAFNAATGHAASFTEPGYPYTGQPFGWQEDQIVKGIHRGDFIGLTGRWMSLFTGLSLLFLCLSGAVMYFDLWNKRRQVGRRGLFWS